MTHHDHAGLVLDGKYRLESQLAEGGMGVLYRAADVLTGRLLAVKVLRSDKAGREEARARFALEARAVRALRHPHIVQVLTSGEDAVGTQYLVMELLEGMGLQEMLVLRGSLPVADALTLLLPIASALAWAHDLGVLHRDVKPANIFLAKDEGGFTVPKLLDFGMARVEGQARVTRTGHAVGTVGYMAPEQAIGREVSAQADVWSLGAVFFRCLGGVEPFDGPNEANVLLQVALARPRPLRSVERSVPESVARVIERALERDPAARFANMRAFVHALVTAAAEAQVPLVERVDPIGLPDYPRWRAEAVRSAARAHTEHHVLPTQVSYVRSDSRDFVGRLEVLEHLSEGVRKAASGRGGASLILGEAGMGKTRLMQQLALRARELGAQVLRGFCEEGEGAPPYWPWVQMLRSLEREISLENGGLTSLDGLPEGVRSVLEGNSCVDSAEQPRTRHTQRERLRFFDDVASFLERASLLRPLVLLLDDCHWADGASLALLNFLSRRVTQNAIYLVAACRTDANRDGVAPTAVLSECEQYRLTALSEEETRELCLRTAGILLPEPRLRAIIERSGGNPLFVKELSRLYAAPTASAEVAIPLPAAIKDSIQRRLAQRSAECAAMLECAAVLGATFELSSLAYVTDRPASELLDLLDEARRAHLLVDSQGSRSRYRFTHALIQEVLYERLRASRRARIHHAAAEQLLMARSDDPEVLPLIAHHAVRGAQLGHAERAVDLAMSAGRQAVKQLAFEKAHGWFSEALDTLELCEGDRTERRVKILIAAGNAHYRGGQGARAREVYEKAATLAQGAGCAELLAEAALGFAREGALHPVVDVPAVRLLEQALARLPQTDSPTRGRVLAGIAFLLYGNNDPDRVEAMAREAARIADVVGDARTQLAAWIALSLALGESPRIQERLALTERMVEVAQRSADLELEAHARAHRVCDLLRRGELAACESEIQHVEAAGRAGHPLFVWSALHARAALHMARGEFAIAEQTAIAARDLGRTFMPLAVSSSFAAQVFPLYRLQGRLDELRVCVENGFEMLSEVGQRGYKAALHIELGDLAGAREQLEWLTANNFARAPRDWFRMPYWARVTELCWALGDRERAKVAYSELSPHTGQLFTIGSTACEGAIDRMLGMLSAVLGERARSAAEFERAIELNTRLGAIPWLALTQHAFARTLQTSDDARDHARGRALEESVASIVCSHGLRGLQRAAAR